MKLEINHKLAGLVPMADEAEQAILTADIKKRGQLEPIVLWQGKIIDGRCRNKSCIELGIEPLIKELPWNTSEEDARGIVKSLNTRRNLTPTQKIMSACRVSMDEITRPKISDVAKDWGISKRILENARYIAKVRPEFVEPLFNGKSVTIVNTKGEETTSVKISAVYAYVRREAEMSNRDDTFGWSEESYIRTMAGKEWYYENVKKDNVSKDNIATRMIYAELANYKFMRRDHE